MGDAERERHLQRHLREGGGAAGIADDPADPQLREGAREDRLEALATGLAWVFCCSCSVVDRAGSQR